MRRLVIGRRRWLWLGDFGVAIRVLGAASLRRGLKPTVILVGFAARMNSCFDIWRLFDCQRAALAQILKIISRK
jgi:hypothetical protein